VRVVYEIAVVGSGPAGISAAARAAKEGRTHVLLERASHLTDTVYNYQKRKHVMATPNRLPLRSDLRFAEGAREEVLELWSKGVVDARVNVRLDSDVASITGARGGFEIRLADGATVTAAHVVLAIGTQGNPRKLDIPGAEQRFVQYRVEDADDHRGETIVVIGAGDSAIEDALGLACANDVVLVNRGADFPKASAANAARVQSAIAGGAFRALMNARPTRIGAQDIVIETADGEAVVPCDRIVARLGTLPPHAFLKACGIPNAGEAYPPISETYESEISGLYIVGALAGYPLIKHCLKQGYEVIEHILGKPLPPVDEPLLKERLKAAGVTLSVPAFIAELRERIPLFAELPIRHIREFLLRTRIRRVKPGEVIFRRHDYTNQLYWVLVGRIALESDEPIAERIVSGHGDFIGALDFVSGRRRIATAVAETPSILVEADRPAMGILFRASPEIRRAIDDTAVARQIRLHLAPGIGERPLKELVRSARIDRFKPGEVLIEEGDTDDPLYLVRKGSVTVSRRIGGKDTILAFLPAGSYIGEMTQLTAERGAACVKAATTTEAIRIDREAFRHLLDAAPELGRYIARTVAGHLRVPAMDTQRAGLVEFLLKEGMGEATDLLLIDETRCVGCDNCEKACAETHGGLSALDRESGARHGTINLPNACRHCEHPHCMAECPTDAIHRAPDGAIYIDDTCNGCGYCESNCPYDAIRLTAMPERKPGLLAWLLFGWGSGPGEDKSPEALARRSGNKHAVKCDMCRGQGAPACVSACPTGAAKRVAPEAFITATLGSRT
jgi:CRP-like cAMP-binding protein/thioredoxin reductase/Fe-S-cluster-containing dehydrogenase component